MTSEYQPQCVPMGEFGARLSPNLFVVSWLGMSHPRIDCHVYVLRGPDGLLLIDCGTPWGYERIVRNMAHFGLDVADVRTILATHGHVDHITGGYFFKQRGAEILAHVESVTVTETQWEACGVMDERGQAYRVNSVLDEGDRISRCGFDVRVFHTSGHSRGCLSFLIEVDGATCLFSGDLIMADAMPGWPGDPGYDPLAIAYNLQRLAGRYEHFCGGHAAILNDRGRLFEQALKRSQAGDWEVRNAEAAALRPRAPSGKA